MNFWEVIKKAKSQVVVIGTLPFRLELEGASRNIADLLMLRENLTITILYESNTELFQQSISLNSNTESLTYSKMLAAKNRISGRKGVGGLRSEVEEHCREGEKADIINRLVILQINCRMPLNVVMVDDNYWTAEQLTTFIEPKDYKLIDINNIDRINSLNDYVGKFMSEGYWKKYLSNEAADDLIPVFDRRRYPHGVLPRKSFYTTNYARYVVWVLVFNWNGQILLHKRSNETKDNRSLWDKSIGGHVDIEDPASSITAKRELVEEMYLPEAEFTDYVKADIMDVIDYGDWNTSKKPEKSFVAQISTLTRKDWALFRATDGERGTPITVERVSERRFSEDNKVTVKKTVMLADVFFMLAPKGQIDTHDSMKQALGKSEIKGVASDHRLVTLEELSKWIEQEEAELKEKEVFTDDLVYLVREHYEEIEEFAEFARYLSRLV